MVTAKGVMSQTGGLADKALSVINTLAGPIGVAQALTAELFADGRKLEDIPNHLMNIASNYKVANPIYTLNAAFQNPSSFPIIPGIMNAAIGLGLDMAGESLGYSIVKKIGSALIKNGTAMAATSFVWSWIALAKYNPHGAGYQGTPQPGFGQGASVGSTEGFIMRSGAKNNFRQSMTGMVGG